MRAGVIVRAWRAILGGGRPLSFTVRSHPSTVPKPHDIAQDAPLTPQEQAVVDALSRELLRKIDEALLSHATKTNRKVAMLIGLTMEDPSLRVPGLPDLFYAQRIATLVDKGLLLAEGTLGYMRYSEVRLP